MKERKLRHDSEGKLFVLLAKLDIMPCRYYAVSMADMLLGRSTPAEVYENDWLITLPIESKLVAPYLIYTPRLKR